MIDMDELQTRWRESQGLIASAMQRYASEGRSNGSVIIQQYLRKFQDADPARAEAARQIAEETGREIADFDRRAGQLVSKVALARLQSEHLALSEAAGAAGDILKKTSDYLDQTMARLRREDQPLHQLTPEGGPDPLEDRKTRAADAGEAAIAITRLAATVYNLRSDTLEAFRSENLEVGRDELVRRLKAMLIEIPKEEAFARLRKLVRELLAEHLKKWPIIGWAVWIHGKIKKLTAPKAGTAPGDTDIMLKLLPALKRDRRFIDELEAIYEKLMAT
ncbi:hypothetical protein [Pelagibacterium sp.]|uniref:hypothetical protein n=1 Tax=Pelagibacterium sp. TaxID=1967288 RepID=UPI003A8CF061